jgi:DNA-binding response OmpR family regulator
LLDVNLQDENGWDLAEQLRLAQPALPIVMVTACPNQASHPRASMVEAVLDKPLDLDLFLERIARVLASSAEQVSGDGRVTVVGNNELRGKELTP